MLLFYYSKDSSALAAHILLEEVGAEYRAVEVPISEGAHRTTEFLMLSPKGRIPVLETHDGVISENLAILEYIAATHPASHMVPEGAFAQAQARSLAAYLGNTMQVAFAHHLRGARWATQNSSLRDMAQMVPRNLHDCAAYLEANVTFDPWAMGDQFSYCDPYLALVHRWFCKVGAELDRFPRIAAHQNAMKERRSVRKVLALHGISEN